jgi:hypothetical protein
VICSHIHGDLVTGADCLKFEVHLATRTIEKLALGATLTVLIDVNIMASERDQANSMSNELIMESTCVLMDLYQVDRHSWYL